MGTVIRPNQVTLELLGRAESTAISPLRSTFTTAEARTAAGGRRRSPLTLGQPRLPTALIIDDDFPQSAVVAAALERVGLLVFATPTTSAAYAMATSMNLDLLAIPFGRPAAHGLDLLERLRRDGIVLPFIAYGAHLSIGDAIDATRRGALYALDTTLPTNELAAMVVQSFGDLATLGRGLREPRRAVQELTGSSAHRWAAHVVTLCRAPHDPRTLEQWARFVAVSYSSLAETCRMVHVRPQAARDFARALRILLWSRAEDCAPEVFLDISDRRTLNTFLQRAGLGADRRPSSFQEFVDGQGFLPSNAPALRVLRDYFTSLCCDEERSIGSAE